MHMAIQPRKSRLDRRHQLFGRFRLISHQPQSARLELTEIALVIGLQPHAPEAFHQMRTPVGHFHAGGGNQEDRFRA
jgi:hypothetical protein